MLEQEEYKREGVDWTEIKFVDNQPLLDLFLGKPIGLLTLMDEAAHFPQVQENHNSLPQQVYANKCSYRCLEIANFVLKPN